MMNAYCNILYVLIHVWKIPSSVEMLQAVDENKLSFNKHICQYRFNINECNMRLISLAAC